MTTPFWCLVVIAGMPIGLAFVGDYFRYADLGSIDNSDPRGQAARLQGAGARGYAAQANAWEALPVFAVAVLVAHLSGGEPSRSAIAAVAFVIARAAHAVFYIAGLSTLRSLSFLVWVRLLHLAGCHRGWRVARLPPNEALQMPANSAFQLRFGSLLAFNLGGSAIFGGAVVRS